MRKANCITTAKMRLLGLLPLLVSCAQALTTHKCILVEPNVENSLTLLNTAPVNASVVVYQQPYPLKASNLYIYPAYISEGGIVDRNSYRYKTPFYLVNGDVRHELWSYNETSNNYAFLDPYMAHTWTFDGFDQLQRVCFLAYQYVGEYQEATMDAIQVTEKHSHGYLSVALYSQYKWFVLELTVVLVLVCHYLSSGTRSVLQLPFYNMYAHSIHGMTFLSIALATSVDLLIRIAVYQYYNTHEVPISHLANILIFDRGNIVGWLWYLAVFASTSWTVSPTKTLTTTSSTGRIIVLGHERVWDSACLIMVIISACLKFLFVWLYHCYYEVTANLSFTADPLANTAHAYIDALNWVFLSFWLIFRLTEDPSLHPRLDQPCTRCIYTWSPTHRSYPDIHINGVSHCSAELFPEIFSKLCLFLIYSVVSRLVRLGWFIGVHSPVSSPEGFFDYYLASYTDLVFEQTADPVMFTYPWFFLVKVLDGSLATVIILYGLYVISETHLKVRRALIEGQGERPA